MKKSTLGLLACPQCHGPLDWVSLDSRPIRTGNLHCPHCMVDFKIVQGIPYFIHLAQLSGMNLRFSRWYDCMSWGYRFFSKVAFAYIGMDEETGRREITDRLDPHGGRVLEVSVGPGVNLPYLVKRPDVGEVFGLDISLGQLRHCQSYQAKKGWEVDLFLGNAECLPFRDEVFDGVFHVGGINFFNNKKAAIDEMIRVAKPGVRVLIADETEKGAQGYEMFFPGFKRSFGGKRAVITAPVDLIPPAMQEMRVFDVWKGWLYCLEFRKP